MDPAARRELEGVRDSLLRRSISDKKVAGVGSNTDANLQARSLLESPFIRKSLNGVGLISGGLLGHMTGVPVFGELAGAGIGANLGEGLATVNRRVMSKVGEKASNAQKAADALEVYRLKQKRLGLLPQYLLPYEQ